MILSDQDEVTGLRCGSPLPTPLDVLLVRVAATNKRRKTIQYFGRV